MNTQRITLTLAAGLIAAAPAFAQDRAAAGSDDDVHTGEPIVVTAPYVRSLDILGNVSVLEGDELALCYFKDHK